MLSRPKLLCGEPWLIACRLEAFTSKSRNPRAKRRQTARRVLCEEVRAVRGDLNLPMPRDIQIFRVLAAVTAHCLCSGASRVLLVFRFWFPIDPATGRAIKGGCCWSTPTVEGHVIAPKCCDHGFMLRTGLAGPSEQTPFVPSLRRSKETLLQCPNRSP